MEKKKKKVEKKETVIVFWNEGDGVYSNVEFDDIISDYDEIEDAVWEEIMERIKKYKFNTKQEAEAFVYALTEFSDNIISAYPCGEVLTQADYDIFTTLDKARMIQNKRGTK